MNAKSANSAQKKMRRITSILSASFVAGLLLVPSNSAHAADGLWTYPVPETVMKEVEAAREMAHQKLMDIPAWNATLFGPFPAAAITTQANDITFVHINLPSTHANKTASVRMGVLKGTTWVNTTLGSLKLNMYGNGTYKTAIPMPSGTRAQVYVGGKLITTTIRA
jgi:hypothetical protein